MNNLIQIVILGIIEGVTEFLPISSTGHLLIVQHFEWFTRRSDAFNIVIQLGAILAVVVIYWGTLIDLAKNWRQPAQWDMIKKLFVSFFITCVLGFAAKKMGLALPEEVTPVAWALIIGAFVIFFAEWRLKGRHGSDTITWTMAVAVGIAQIIAAIFPGTSRSGASIFAAMLLGNSRVKATEFSFLVGIPTMFAASGYELFDLIKDGEFPVGELMDIAIGFVISGLVAFIVVKWLLKFVQTHSFVPFAWYRLALGVVLLVYFGLIATQPAPKLDTPEDIPGPATQMLAPVETGNV